jgi:hypothetical protein
MLKRVLIVVVLWLGLVMALPTPAALAHVPVFAPDSVSSWQTALVVPDHRISWAIFGRLADPEEVDFFAFEAKAGETAVVGLNVPRISGLENFRMSVAVVGAGLPQTNVLPVTLPNNFGAVIKPDDGKTSVIVHGYAYWERQDLSVRIPSDGRYYVLLWNPEHMVGKYTLSIGTIERYMAPPPGTSGNIGQFFSHPVGLDVLYSVGVPLFAPRCFSETGKCIQGRIRAYWEANGGIPVFGLPITEQRTETVEGKAVELQWFERNRLELHPQNSLAFRVLLGRLGYDRLQQQNRDWGAFPKDQPKIGCRYFAETGHNICEPFLRVWRLANGKSNNAEAAAIALYGLPLSSAQTERMADGQEQLVQWFERARFEYHPANSQPFDVLLGLLGNEVRANQPLATFNLSAYLLIN